METANDTEIQVTETKKLCSNTISPITNSEEITKDQEEELLGGNSEDGDEEDALSDDSMRLRLSDDETEVDEPNSEHSATKKTSEQRRNMEPGSDVSAIDTSEQKKTMKIKNLSNGILASENVRVKQEGQGSNDSFAEDVVPNTDGFFYMSEDSKYCNGDVIKTEAKSTSENSKIKTAKWEFSGHFGKYSSEKNSIVQSQKPHLTSNKYAADSYKNKYYNMNNYYGRGKGSGSMYSSYFRESSSRDKISEEKCSTRDRSSPAPSKEPVNAQSEYALPQPIKTEAPAIETSDSDKNVSNDADPQSSVSDDTREPASVDEGGADGVSTKNNDDAETSPIGADTLIPLEAPQHTDPNDGNQVADPENKNQLADANNENQPADANNEIQPADANNENQPADANNENPPDDVNNENQPTDVNIESQPADVNIENQPADVNIENQPADVNIENQSADVNIENQPADANIGSQPADPSDGNQPADPSDGNQPADPTADGNLSSTVVEVEDVKPKIVDASDVILPIDDSTPSVGETVVEDQDNVANKTETKPVDPKVLDPTVKEADVGSEKIDETVVPEKSNECTNKPDSADNFKSEILEKKDVSIEDVKPDDTASVQANDEGSLERAELELVAEIEKNDDRNEVNEEQIKKDDPEEPEKMVISVEEPEKSEVKPTVVTPPPEEQSRIVDSKEALKDCAIVEINDKDIVEIDNASDGKKLDSESKIIGIEARIADLPDEKETSEEDEGESKDVKVMHSSLKRMSTDSLDEMELCRRIRIRRKNPESDVSIGQPTFGAAASTKEPEVINEPDPKPRTDVDSSINLIADEKTSLDSATSLTSNTVTENSTGQLKNVEPRSNDGKENIENIDDCEVIEIPVKKRQKRSRRSMQPVRESVISHHDNEEKENVRQKRRTATKAEEIIRKEFLANSDSESIDVAENFVAVNYNKNGNKLRSASPPSLKRYYVEEGEKLEAAMIKKLKQDSDGNGVVPKKSETMATDKTQTLSHVRRFFRRDNNGKLAKLKQEELEELLIQKIVETITMRDEIGKLREQAKISERNQEATRLRCQQLAKQIKDFEMVLNRYNSDRRANPEKNVVPIKINRSVGLQVNWVTDSGIHNLRQLEQIQKVQPPIVNGTNSTQRIEQSPSNVAVPTRTIKVRSPRRPDPPVATPTNPTVSTPIHNQHPPVSNAAPSPLIVAKNVTDSRTPVISSNIRQPTVPHPIAPKQTIVVNGPIANQPIRQVTAIQVSKSNKSDLIDLTQEEDKTKSNVVVQKTVVSTAMAEAAPKISTPQKIAPRYHTVLQALPGSVAISAQSGIRVVQPSGHPTPTALVNNMNAPRLTYVMQGGIGPPRQVVVTSTPTPIRPAPAIRTSFPLSGTITNGTVRVIPMSSAATIQVYKHPAALPEPINPPSNPSWKLPPPAPSLKISKVTNGIVLSWNMALSDKFAEIASYQLFAYQEVSGIAPSATLWKKVGDVRALPLPMACTLTQFSEGNNYYFAVRGVDKHTRFGFYSQPGHISL